VLVVLHGLDSVRPSVELCRVDEQCVDADGVHRTCAIDRWVGFMQLNDPFVHAHSVRLRGQTAIHLGRWGAWRSEEVGLRSVPAPRTTAMTESSCPVGLALDMFTCRTW